MTQVFRENIIPVNNILKEAAIAKLRIIHEQIGSLRASDDSLLNGNLGLIPYHFHISKTLNTGNGPEACTEILEDIFSAINNEKSSLKSFHYSNGLAGLGYILQYLVDQDYIDFDFVEEFELFDEIIFENCILQLQLGYLEFFHGAAGILHYFGTRQKDQRIVRYINTIIKECFIQINRDPLNFRIPRSVFAWTENDDYDLSLSHGLCGFLLVLINNYQYVDDDIKLLISGYLSSAARQVSNIAVKPDILNGHTSWLPSYWSKSWSPSDFLQSKGWGNGRLAWCYGDLGWVLFFYHYANFSNDSGYYDLANKIGLSTTQRRTSATTSSITAHFCHGHAGLAQIYRTLYKMTGEEAYLDSYHFWIEETITALDAELKSGFQKGNPMETAFLEGLPGISLVLNSYVSDHADNWSKFYLI